MRNWLWYLMRNSAVSRACSSELPSSLPETTRLPANSDAPLFPTRPLQMMSGLMPFFRKGSVAARGSAPDDSHVGLDGLQRPLHAPHSGVPLSNKRLSASPGSRRHDR